LVSEILAESVVEFHRAVKDYGRKEIGPLDFEIKTGEIVGFLGPNGSGKTTSIRLILGLIRPSSGEVLVNGFNPITKHVQALCHVGYSPELPNIQAFLTPQELLALVAKEISLKGNSIEDEIAQVLELVGLSEYRYVKVGKLSKGMVQRLSIAQAMIGAPHFLVLDEPMIGLDPAGTVHLREVFRKFVANNDGTIFLSSHMMNEVENLCDSIIMIHNGRILLKGSLEEVTKKALGFAAITVEAEDVSDSSIEAIQRLEGVGRILRENSKLIQIEVVDGSEEELRPKIAEIIVGSHSKLYTIKPSEDMLERAYMKALSQGEVY
jgi:ABC-2 type transport system ATP-binding protein